MCGNWSLKDDQGESERFVVLTGSWGQTKFRKTKGIAVDNPYGLHIIWSLTPYGVGSMKKKKPAKVNRAIYIDSRLDARMKKASDVNWSAIASAAFERELQRHEWRTTMGNVVERLRASKNEAISEGRDVGEAAGREWALQQASYVELHGSHEWTRVRRVF